MVSNNLLPACSIMVATDKSTLWAIETMPGFVNFFSDQTEVVISFEYLKFELL